MCISGFCLIFLASDCEKKPVNPRLVKKLEYKFIFIVTMETQIKPNKNTHRT